MRSSILVALTGIILLTQGCATTSTTTRTIWSEPSEGEMRQGQVEWIRETVQQTQGDPALGAVAGAVVGGVLGGLITGHRGGAVVGAATGAIIGASESQAYREDRTYDVLVRFDDGKSHVFRYRGYPPFRPGQVVGLTSRGLMGLDSFVTSSASETAIRSAQEESPTDEAIPSSPEPDDDIPPPPPSEVNAATAGPPVGQRSAPAGQWAYTEQYGWIWMPYGATYTFTPHYDNGDPYMFVYYPTAGWTWVEAPWLWGWGPRPYFRVGTTLNFSWYSHDWGQHWHSGRRPSHYRRSVSSRRR